MHAVYIRIGGTQSSWLLIEFNHSLLPLILSELLEYGPLYIEYRKGVKAQEAKHIYKRTLKAKLLNEEIIEEGNLILILILNIKDI